MALIVDDIADNRMVIRGYLESHAFQIMEAENGEEAVGMTKNRRPDIILMDIKMPVMSGIDATRTIKTDPELKTIPVIAITASAMKSSTEKISAMCDGYLRKPVGKTELIAELAKFLKHTDEASSMSSANNPPESETIHDTVPPERRAGLARILADEFLPEWETISETLIFDELNAFADRIKTLAEEYECAALTRWIGKIGLRMEQYDIDGLRETFAKFGDLIEKIGKVGPS
jgi:CheY-like chemotaxis protein